MTWFCGFCGEENGMVQTACSKCDNSKVRGESVKRSKKGREEQ